MAQYEICSLLAVKGDREGLAAAAFHLYQELVGGRWLLEKARYLFYAATAREWLTANGTPSADVTRWITVEEQKRLLSDAIVEMFDAAGPSSLPSDGRFLMLRASGSRGVVSVVATTWLATHVWPDTFKTTIAEGVDLASSFAVLWHPTTGSPRTSSRTTGGQFSWTGIARRHDGKPARHRRCP